MEGSHSCSLCTREFKTSRGLSMHMFHTHKRNRNVPALSCHNCGSVFPDTKRLRRHYALKHLNEEKRLFRCDLCRLGFYSAISARRHRREVHSGQTLYEERSGSRSFTYGAGAGGGHSGENEAGGGGGVDNSGFPPVAFQMVQAAHNNKCLILRHNLPERIHFLEDAQTHVFPAILKVLRHKQQELKSYKVKITIGVEFVKIDEEGQIEQIVNAPFHSHLHSVNHLDSEDVITNKIQSMFNEIILAFENYVSLGSGYSLNDLHYVEIKIAAKKDLIGAASHMHSVQMQYTRDKERTKKTLTQNVVFNKKTFEGGDEDCFFLAVASHFVAKEDRENIYVLREFCQQNFNLDGIPAPVDLANVKLFEQRHQEKLNLSITVLYQDEDAQIYPVHVSSNVLVENQIILCLYISLTDDSVSNSPPNIDVNETDDSEIIYHYAYIVNPVKFLQPRIQYGSKNKTYISPRYFCFNCFNAQTREDAFLRHIAWCHTKKGQCIIMPKSGDVECYDKESKSNDRQIAYINFFDFETLQAEPTSLPPCSCFKSAEDFIASGIDDQAEDADASFLQSAAAHSGYCDKHKTWIRKEHKPFAFSSLTVSRDGKIVDEMTKISTSSEEDVAADFLNYLLDLEEFILDGYLEANGGANFDNYVPERNRVRQRVENGEIITCHLCKQIIDPSVKRELVLDHDHVTGQFLGTAHNKCNLAAREKFRIVAFAHNFSGYDSHCLIKALPKIRSDRITSISAIPLNTQKFKCLEINSRILFLDSLAFLPDSLEKLTETLVASNHSFSLLRERWPDERERNLLLRKGVYPYDYMTDLSVLARNLPSRDKFFSEIGERHISEEDYEHAKKVWQTFKCESLRDYTALYVTCDVYLLAEAVMDLRSSVWDEFGLDIAKYLSLPMLTKDLMLKTSEVSIELISDQEMTHLIQSNIRGGLSFINMRYFDSVKVTRAADEAVLRAPPSSSSSSSSSRSQFRGSLSPVSSSSQRASLPSLSQLPPAVRKEASRQWAKERRLRSEMDPSVKSCRRSITYADANNLYGKAMCFPMPLGQFRWLSDLEIDEINFDSDITEDSNVGYFFEVTLDYPEDLHLLHHSFPLAPEEKEITENDLSAYAFDCLTTLRRQSDIRNQTYKARKLTATFNRREKYLCHGLNLKLYLKLGLKLIQIHRVIAFEQTPFMREYIQGCTQKRIEAKTKTRSNMMKLLCNSLYGKMIESNANRMECKFNRTEKNALARFSDPLFMSFLIFGENFSVTFHRKKILQMKQLWPVGFAILELSKYVMQSLMYVDIKPTLCNRLNVLMSDTDSWIFATDESDSNSCLAKIHPVMDFSNYEKSHPLYDGSREKQPGFLKNEVPAAQITHFVGLRSKTYAFKVANQDKIESRAKGVKKCYKNKIPFEDYFKCIRTISKKNVVQKHILSKNHQNVLVESNRVAFSSFDDKRYLLCPIHSTPYGSVLIKYQKDNNGRCFFCDHPYILC